MRIETPKQDARKALLKDSLSFRFQLVTTVTVILLTVFLFGNARTNAGLQQDARQQQSGVSPKREDDAKSAKPAPNVTSIFVSSQDDYYIGPTDVLTIKVADAEELDGTYPVSSAGYIEMRLLGRISAMNKTPDQVAAAIREALVKEDYLKAPKVSVEVSEYNSRTFYIQGSVNTPGAYKIRGKVSILQLITLAGGLKENHGPNAYIYRRSKTAAAMTTKTPGENGSAATAGATTTPNGEDAAEYQNYEVLVKNINGLDRGMVEQNIFLEPGDVVTVPQLSAFIIGGEVVAPGSYPLKEGTTIRQALQLAQGPTFKAKMGSAVIFRGDNKDGKQLEIPVDLNAVMSGKKGDILLQADDLIVIPSSKMRAVTGALLQSFGMATVQRGMIVR